MIKKGYKSLFDSNENIIYYSKYRVFDIEINEAGEKYTVLSKQFENIYDQLTNLNYKEFKKCYIGITVGDIDNIISLAIITSNMKFLQMYSVSVEKMKNQKIPSYYDFTHNTASEEYSAIDWYSSLQL